MSSPITMRELAPQWNVASGDDGEPSALLGELCRRFGGEGALLFRIRVGETPPRTTVLVNSGIEESFRDSVVERATGAIVNRERNEVLPMMIPAWRVGGASAFIYAFPGCARTHGQLVTAILAVEQMSFAAIAEAYLAGRCMMEAFDETPIGRAAGPDHPRITVREQSCLAWTAEGKTSEEIGIILDLSPHTVNHYLGSAARKLGATNRMHAVAKALRLGLIERPV
ncbi:helix-turn-helix transcriptional regulator [Oricola sp.]|uniref:helix-turn-helix transcriptional regulator n=1 Tax=Oricola sp. TaxID=1979950 RepID=UPI0025CC2116|nr:helix-turn-helix transcriptional regulator [Oricola sp.]MCI5078440.1 helix-turn-helix transcriptional regulator [Oricola sp.]